MAELKTKEEKLSVPEMTEWKLVYSDWDPSQQALREALCALGNGNFVTRGALEWTSADGVNYPGAYLAGGYNRLDSEVAGRIIENEDLVNWPNWLSLKFRHEEGPWFSFDDFTLDNCRQELDVQHGVLYTWIEFHDQNERRTRLHTQRFVHMENPHLAAIQWTLTPLNWSGVIQVQSALDGTVVNSGVARYRQLSNRHLDVLETGVADDDILFLLARANQSHIVMAQAARTTILHAGEKEPPKRKVIREPDYVGHILDVHCREGKEVCIEKTVAIYTSRDLAISEPCLEARNTASLAGRFRDLRASHERAWRRLWRRCDIRLQNDTRTQFLLRLHIFHLLQTTSINSIGKDTGVPARGWHGEAYRGHIFWDELFIFPFLNLRLPEVTRSLLMYRYRRLPQARREAGEAGYAGAMFPWQSGSNGREESQVIHLNPRSGKWIPDNTHRQRHVNAAIIYNIWQYFQATNDMEFIHFYGAEMVLDIARFWASTATYNEERERYEIRGVVGPDEFHTRYPDGDSPGLNNNTYTNVLAAWSLDTALSILELIGETRKAELLEILGISAEELERWEDISRRMFIAFHDDRIISQFEGYEDLEEFDWDGYEKKYGDIQRLDRILEEEGDDVNRYKAGKQADVLMLFYLFSREELEALFKRLGYAFDNDLIPRNVKYYMKRTSHGSTLSRVVHSWVLARSDRENAWRLFQTALTSDVGDIQGGTTSEGIHLGAMAGTVDLLQRGHTGIEMRDDVLWLNPCLPDELKEVHLRVRYCGHWLTLAISHKKLCVSVALGWFRPVKIGFRGRTYTLAQGDHREFKLSKRYAGE